MNNKLSGRKNASYRASDLELLPWPAAGWVQRFQHGETEFCCKRCGVLVTTDPLLSGVQNRNHCPYCLWSRHLDLKRSGDRLAACKSRMRPVGLTLKFSSKKYARERSGELMLIHHCEECGRISINRVAADDDTDRILEIFERSRRSEPELAAQIEENGIRLLSHADRGILYERLLGR